MMILSEVLSQLDDKPMSRLLTVQILALGMAWQNETAYHLQQPPIDNVEPSVLAQCTPYSRCTLPPSTFPPAASPSAFINTVNSNGTADSG